MLLRPRDGGAGSSLRKEQQAGGVAVVGQCGGEAGQPRVAGGPVGRQGATPPRCALPGLGGQAVVQAKHRGAGQGGVPVRPVEKRRPKHTAGRRVVVTAFESIQTM